MGANTLCAGIETQYTYVYIQNGTATSSALR